MNKITLRTAAIKKLDSVVISPGEIKAIREQLNLSQAVFACRLRMSVRTYQGWEQGQTSPNHQAVLLLRMVAQSPDIFEQIASL